VLPSSRGARGGGLGLGCLLFGLALTVASLFALAAASEADHKVRASPSPSLLAAPGSNSSAPAPVGWWIARRIWVASLVGIPALLVLG
jgi:predicted lysophospholipase L1 biosynthesis ABC-type transport system permease subunit